MPIFICKWATLISLIGTMFIDCLTLYTGNAKAIHVVSELKQAKKDDGDDFSAIAGCGAGRIHFRRLYMGSCVQLPTFVAVVPWKHCLPMVIDISNPTPSLHQSWRRLINPSAHFATCYIYCISPSFSSDRKIIIFTWYIPVKHANVQMLKSDSTKS